MKKMWIFVLLMFAFNTNAQEPDTISPIFPYNTCAEPCWLGIVPGVSTSLDVDDMLENFSNIVTIGEYGRGISRLENGKYAIDEMTGIIKQGVYGFDVLTQTTQFPTFGVASRIEIRDSIVSLIMILASEEYDITLADILTSIGTPDQIRMYSTDNFETFEFRLLYSKEFIRINLYQFGDSCHTNNVLDNYMLLNTLFYSENMALEPKYSVDRLILHPRLYVYLFETERNIPLNVWESWLSGEVEESCYEAWEKLKPPDLKALAITPTSTAEVTAEPTP